MIVVEVEEKKTKPEYILNLQPTRFGNDPNVGHMK